MPVYKFTKLNVYTNELIYLRCNLKGANVEKINFSLCNLAVVKNYSRFGCSTQKLLTSHAQEGANQGKLLEMKLIIFDNQLNRISLYPISSTDTCLS